MAVHMLRSPDAAKYVGLAPQTLAKFRVVGNGPKFCKLGRIVVYDPRDLDEWLHTLKRRSTSESPNVA
jgi:predicted DNA-binding transcriptional regulator AlpA